MIQRPSPLDEAELRHEMRRMYRQIGPLAAWQVLYELLKSAEYLADIMLEEGKR